MHLLVAVIRWLLTWLVGRVFGRAGLAQGRVWADGPRALRRSPELARRRRGARCGPWARAAQWLTGRMAGQAVALRAGALLPALWPRNRLQPVPSFCPDTVLRRTSRPRRP
jgi:hypothetical protein